MAHGSNILPVYILADESGSLGPHLEEINQGLETIVSVLASEPLAAAKIRLSVIGFADIATVRLRLADIRKLPMLPPLQTGGSSNYCPAFSALRKLIPEDVAELKSEGYAVHRPAAFFLSDGQPSDGDQWRTEHQQLIDRSVMGAAPNIIACGIGDAEAATMLAVATSPEFAFVVARGLDVGPAIARFCVALTKSVVASGRSLAGGAPQLVVERPEGFRMAIDAV